MFLPKHQIDEHSYREKSASHGRVATQEEEKVAEQTQEDHPDHVQFKEQVEDVESSCHCGQMLQNGGEACHRKGERGESDHLGYAGTEGTQKYSLNIQRRRHSRQITSSCHTCSRPCWAVGSRQP